jgi:hypothetical protein
MNETACAGTLGVGACGCTCAVETLGVGGFLGAGTVEGRVGAAIGAVGAAGAAAWGAGFAFCAGTRRNREDGTVGSDFRF